jgi:hypothetical protein
MYFSPDDKKISRFYRFSVCQLYLYPFQIGIQDPYHYLAAFAKRCPAAIVRFFIPSIYQAAGSGECLSDERYKSGYDPDGCPNADRPVCKLALACSGYLK